LCEKVCKANCIHADAKRLDFSVCIGCFNCFDVCPSVGLKYDAFWKKKPVKREAVVDGERRTFLGGAASSLFSFALPDTAAKDSASVVALSFDESRKCPIAPPGALSIDHFTNLCTACQLCVSACPTQVLYPSFLEYGLSGILQPRMNYDASFCNYDCVLCSEICPSGAILRVDAAAKKEIQIGKSVFVKEDCIVITKKKECGACAEQCPTKAVKMVPYEGKLKLPELNNEICVGCGACEHPCPTTPRKAIYVVANPVHLRAKKPQVQKLEEAVDTSKEFPF
jgi:ferredoxin